MTDLERIERALENQLSSEEWKQLQQDIVADPELRVKYVEHAWIHGQLRSERHLLADLLVEDSPRPLRFMGSVIWAAAAVLIAALVILATSGEDLPETVATLIEAEDCKWAGSDLPTAQGARLGPGTLALVEGMATLEFESGATVTLEAPTTLEILSKMRCRLIEGSVVADVPEPAHGFTIDTPSLEVIDLGTRFGVTASAFGDSHVFVFEGEVEVARENRENQLLTTGKALHHGSDPPLEGHEIARETAKIEAEDGWMAVPTSYGQGKDAYVRRSYSKSTGQEPLLMVKHTELAAGNERRAFLTFDLSSAATSAVQSAELVLDIEPSGLGFSALVPDSRFAVYGFIDDDLDSWDEQSVHWKNAPASMESGLEPGRVRRLGDFTIRRGANPALIQFSSPELVDFIREDGNRLVSLAILRETGESDTQGLVHAFASKEHPSARPPTLRLKTR